MTEKDFDKLTMETMINLYNTIDEQIHIEGMAYCDHMSIEEISQTLLDQITL